jgi:hypothetical protein
MYFPFVQFIFHHKDIQSPILEIGVEYNQAAFPRFPRIVGNKRNLAGWKGFPMPYAEFLSEQKHAFSEPVIYAARKRCFTFVV